MTSIEDFLIDIIELLFRDWIEKTIGDTGRYVAPTDIFQPTLHNIFYKRRPIIYLYGRGSFVVRCRLQNLQCTAWSFRASSTDAVFRSTLGCSHLVGKENISPPRKKKIMIHRYWSKKKARWRRPEKMTDPGLKNKNHRMKPIEHFLIDIVQILSGDWIEKTIGSLISKCWPIIFFYGIGSFVVRCRLQNLQCRSALFFCANSTEVVFRPTLACSHLLG